MSMIIHNDKILRKLDGLKDLPSIPAFLSDVLTALDDSKLNASAIAKLIEKDQSLTAKVLRVANSPFYGFSRRISTIELAVVIMGTNTIKEILLSLFMQKFVSRMKSGMFNLKQFWDYSLYCAVASRLFARKLGFKLAGEAFVAGLLHDIGILIIAEYFNSKYKEIKTYQRENKVTLLDAEIAILETNHCEIGEYVANKWNLPPQICKAIANHHTPISQVIDDISDSILDNIKQPLTAFVSISEWLAGLLDLKYWSGDILAPPFYISGELFEDIDDYDFLSPDSALTVLKSEIDSEFEKAMQISEITTL